MLATGITSSRPQAGIALLLRRPRLSSSRLIAEIPARAAWAPALAATAWRASPASPAGTQSIRVRPPARSDRQGPRSFPLAHRHPSFPERRRWARREPAMRTSRPGIWRAIRRRRSRSCRRLSPLRSMPSLTVITQDHPASSRLALPAGDPRVPQHTGQVGEYPHVESEQTRLAAAIGVARRKCQRSPLARVADVDVPYSGQPPLIENRQPLAGQRVERVGDDQRTRSGTASSRSMRGSLR
jgi:hypothetical protein